MLLGSGLCEVHDQPRKRNENKVTRKEVLIPGAVIGGSTVIRIVDEAHVQMECGGCQKPYITRRSTIIRARLYNRVARCSRTKLEVA
jgi:hypothetical protein